MNNWGHLNTSCSINVTSDVELLSYYHLMIYLQNINIQLIINQIQNLVEFQMSISLISYIIGSSTNQFVLHTMISKHIDNFKFLVSFHP